MSESMIERVARALCALNGNNPDATIPASLEADAEQVSVWTEFVPEARAAIGAMRAHMMQSEDVVGYAQAIFLIDAILAEHQVTQPDSTP
jgi:hypothetical protein